MTAGIVRLSIIPSCGSPTPSPALMDSTPLVADSSVAPSSKAMVKSTYDTGPPKSWRVNSGMNGVLCTNLKCAKSTPFSIVLRMQLQTRTVEGRGGNRRIVVVGGLTIGKISEYVGHIEIRFPALNVVPDPHGRIAFDGRIAADPAALLGAFSYGTHIAAVGIPFQAVERADQILALDVPAVSEVRTEVLATGVEHRHPARCGPPGHHLPAEVLHLVDRTDGDLRRPGDLEPAGRFHRQWWRCHAPNLPMRERVIRSDRRLSEGRRSIGVQESCGT